mmetsp:Transcript_59146/g.86756  ORF Transcript_59146/g.86756 Transcript_59146/m.86756 type:complete len:186 (-) Transcript_59146:51-608(-)
MVGKKDTAGTANAVAAFHHVVAKGDLEKVKDFALGGERKPGHIRIPVNSQDEEGLAAIHWAAMRGHKNVLKYLIETAPENNRADPTVLDKHGWSAVMWAVFMVEQEHKMVGAEHAKRKQLCDVINYLVLTVQGAQDLVGKGDRLLHKSAFELATDAAVASDEGVVAAVKGSWESNKTYGLHKEGE